MRRPTSLLAAALSGALLFGCATSGSQITDSNINVPAGGFGSFADAEQDD